MTSFCTYCSRTKSQDRGEIPAIQRYKSPRIQRVQQAARSLGLGFHILSGRYGLVSPDQPLPYYDHLLKPDEVLTLAAAVAEQIRTKQVTGFVYFTKSLSEDRSLGPYRDVLAVACRDAPVSLCVVELEDGTGISI